MANKKRKKRTTVTARPAGTAPRPAAPVAEGGASAAPPNGARASSTVSRPAQAAGTQGPNRIARKEEARRQREALRRKMQRRKLYRRGAIGLAAIAAVGAIVYFTTRTTPATGEEARLLAQVDDAAEASGCGDIETIEAYPNQQDQTHIGQNVAQMPPLSTYPSQPPVSGPHANVTLAAGVYTDPPPLDQAIHSLEHGAAIIWYDPGAPPEQLTRIQNFFRQPDQQNHVIVAPYNYPDQGAAGRLPEGKGMVLAAWHHLQTCDRPSLPVAFSFVNNYRFEQGSDYEGDAPEAGVPI